MLSHPAVSRQQLSPCQQAALCTALPLSQHLQTGHRAQNWASLQALPNTNELLMSAGLCCDEDSTKGKAPQGHLKP